MSHQPERLEKNCLNCGTTVTGRYCQKCGQENIVPRQTVWGLITHFIYDIFHFDGKFFYTVKHLLFKPGFIPREYIAGKRVSYLDPIRMYLFTSAVFFLILFSFGNTGGLVKMDGSRLMTKMERLEYSSALHQQVKAGNKDSVVEKQLNFLLDTTIRVTLSTSGKADSNRSFLVKIKDQEYLMLVDTIEKGQQDINVGSGWFAKTIQRKWNVYKQKFGDDEKAMLSDLANSFVHKFPYILFVSLPFFALILKLLYIRRKQFFYSDHAVFTLYHYIFTFILLLFYFFLDMLYDWLDWGIVRVIAILVVLSGGVYLLIAMKRFYAQKWFKTIVKFLLLNLLALIIVLMLLVAFIVLSVFQL